MRHTALPRLRESKSLQKETETYVGFKRLERARTGAEGSEGKPSIGLLPALLQTASPMKVMSKAHYVSSVGPGHQNRVSRSPAIIGSIEWVLSSSI